MNAPRDRCHQPLLKILLSQCFFCLLAISNVHRHTKHPHRLPRLVKKDLTFVSNPAQRAIRADYSKFSFVIYPFLESTSHCFFQGFSVFRMNGTEKGFISWMRRASWQTK